MRDLNLFSVCFSCWSFSIDRSEMVVYQQGISIKTVKDASAGFEIAMHNFKTRFGLGGLNSGVHYQVSKQKEIKKICQKQSIRVRYSIVSNFILIQSVEQDFLS